MKTFLHNMDGLNSFCTVATGTYGYEAALLMKSISLQSDKRIHLLTDKANEARLRRAAPENTDVLVIKDSHMRQREAEFQVDPDTVLPACPKFPALWNPATASLKTDIMSKAISESGNTLFMDADVILVNPVTHNFKSEVAISRHNHVGMAGNSGYIFSSCPSFPGYWDRQFRENFATGAVGNFCGQCGDISTTKLSERYKTSEFGVAHNYGPWRISPAASDASGTDRLMDELGFSADDDIYLDEGDGPEKMVSFHVHLCAKGHRSSSRNLIRTFYECLQRSAKEVHRQLMSFIKNIYLPNAFNTMTV
ncbi:MAG TPA: hypothetical protein EYN66_11720 [Myxococcales bacterium]|nr:hypothetical protein [Myxococcales bacterium]